MTLVTTTTTTLTTTQQECDRRRSSLQIVASNQILASLNGNHVDSSSDTITQRRINPVSESTTTTTTATTTSDMIQKPIESSIIMTSPSTLTQSIIHGLCVSTLYLLHFIYMAYIAQKTLRTSINHRWHIFQLGNSFVLSTPTTTTTKTTTIENQGQLGDPFYLLKKDQGRLTKIPHHIAITLSTELLLERSDEDWQAVVDDLCQVSCWAWEMGTREISVFDASGVLKNRKVEITKQQSMALHQWKLQYHPSDLAQNDFKLTILSLEDTQAQLVNATQKSFNHIMKNVTSSIDIDLVNGFMQETMSDPDLMIVYDGLPHQYISLDGYSPWHIRLTEFVNATSYHRLDYALFISCLCKYSRVEQRFGK